MKSNYIFFILGLLMLCSCSPQRNLVYFSDSATKSNSFIPGDAEVKIQPNDLLKITVSSLSVESNALFNVSNNTAGNEQGYRVDKNGSINFPVAGNLKLQGLTLEQAQTRIARELDKFVKNPIVNIQFLNFKITVIGEVNRPSSFTVTDERINILEALGLAGDMTVYGKRENVLVIREVNGERNMTRINLNKRDVLTSPYFYLKQNDIVYVEPDKAKGDQLNRNNRLLPYISAGISVFAVFIQALLNNYYQ